MQFENNYEDNFEINNESNEWQKDEILEKASELRLEIGQIIDSIDEASIDGKPEEESSSFIGEDGIAVLNQSESFIDESGNLVLSLKEENFWH